MAFELWYSEELTPKLANGKRMPVTEAIELFKKSADCFCFVLPYCACEIRKNMVYSFVTDEFWQAVELWARIQRYGMPCSWKDMPAHVFDMVESFDAIKASVDAERMKRK